jgi:hypothetical protein
MRIFSRRLAGAVIVMASSIVCFSQTTRTNITSDNATGLAPGQTFGGSHENIDYSTGDLNIQIPLLTLAGRHGSNLSIGLTYDSKPLLSLNGTWNETEGHGDYTFGPPDDPAALPGGWRLNIPMLQANVHTILTPGPTNSACYKNFMVVTADGSSHTFANIAGCATTLKNSPFTVTPDNASNSTTATADDLPVLLLDTSNPADYVLRGKDGTSFHFFANFGLATASLTTPPVIDADPVFKLPDEIVDANGNIITITNSNGNLIFTDNGGRVVTLTYGSLPPNWSSVLNSVSYLDSSGVQRTITLSYSNFSFNYTLAQPQNLGGRCLPVVPFIFVLGHISKRIVL